MWRFSQNSLFYLLSLWQRMVASVPYIKAQEPHLLETYTPEITNVFITSRLELVSAVVRDGVEDPFDDLGNVYQQLEQVSIQPGFIKTTDSTTVPNRSRCVSVPYCNRTVL